MEGIFLLLGSNLGDKEKLLQLACQKIEDRIGSIVSASSMYETAAWGKTDQPGFLNSVIEVHSFLSPVAMLCEINKIEHELGRTRLEKWGARKIDIDILYFHDRIIQTPLLSIPHPGIPDRRFTLVPLTEIAPGFIHPVLLKSNQELLENCPDPLQVKKLPD